MVPPRPLAGLPAADPRAVARAWLVRRVADAPLEAAPETATATFAQRAPGLCRAVLAALGGDEALAALAAEAGVLRAVVDSGPVSPPGPGALVAAGEHLRGAAIDVLAPGTDPALHAALHDRLAHACAVLVLAALAPGPADAISVHDARPRADPRGDLIAEAERLVAAGTAFGLLAVEIEDASVVPAGALAAAEAALRQVLPPGAMHAPDGPGSMLVLAVGADGRALGRALTGSVAAAASHRGAPLRAAAGVAEHPADGDTPEALLAHADGQLFAARAEGLPLA